jgi:transcriptional regulator NrdR family protein
MRVRKRNGKDEEFVREKIVVAIVGSGGRLDLARTIAQEVEAVLSKNPTVTTEQIRTEVFSRLKSKDARAYNSWVEYDRQTKNRG